MTLRRISAAVFLLSSSLFFFLYSSLHHHLPHPSDIPPPPPSAINLLTLSTPWNSLHLPQSHPPTHPLKIALFVKKWPSPARAGGLERHAATLHRHLAARGHHIHVFTSSPTPPSPSPTLHFHPSKPTPAGYLNQSTIWLQFLAVNNSGEPFAVVHTESVALMHTRSRLLPNLAVTWHGFAYESIHSDIIQNLLNSDDPPALSHRLSTVVEEVKFFPRYAHHVATSDHAGDVLRRIYMLPENRVHVILNGVDDVVFKPEMEKKLGLAFSKSSPKSIVIGIAGRLVKDKGHPLIYEVLDQIFAENSTLRDSLTVLVAGDGPWEARYTRLGPNIRVLGPLDQAGLARFYNSIDVFLNPTLRAQGLDHTLLEAMLVGKPVMATRLGSVMGTVVVGREVGYAFSPTVAALKAALYEAWEDGRDVLRRKGSAARERALRLFTATRMAAAYERLFLCIAGGGAGGYCTYRNV